VELIATHHLPPTCGATNFELPQDLARGSGFENRRAVGGQRVCDCYPIFITAVRLHSFFFIPAGNSCL